MSVVGTIHGGYVHRRRVRVLSERLAGLIPQGASVLDVGCGDGQLASRIMQLRPDVRIRGIDVLVRPAAEIPVEGFDGQTIPYGAGSFDVVMCVDVLHHTQDPMILLRESGRVARQAILIKDHTCNGLWAHSTLRLMDCVGNARHGVALPYNYWSRQQWLRAFTSLVGYGLQVWRKDLGLYPLPANWLFGRSLHFLALLDVAGQPAGQACGDDLWEAAYARFETPAQEVRKFVRRLLQLGAAQWSRDAQIVELFCGRGGGLQALSTLGFTHVEGVDLSAALIRQYKGSCQCYVGDCRQLPFGSQSKDILIVQGGLHHLRTLPADLDRTLAEAHRVLREGGRLVVVEPWLTPFLACVHWLCGRKLARRLSGKVDVLAVMIDHERATYERWLQQPGAILKLISQYFQPEQQQAGWGKLMFVGRKK